MSVKLADLNRQLMESGDFADVEIICQGRSWKAHQAILAARSPWFKRALSGDWTEATTRKIHLDAVKPDLVDILIRYRYTDDLLRTDDGPRETARAPEDTVQLFIQADFFLLAPLCATLLRRLEEQFCQSVMEHFCFDLKGPKNVDGLIRARLCPKRVSERSLPGLLEDLHNAIRLAYSIRTARDLHKTIIAFTLCLRDRMNIADLQDVLSDVPQFQVDLHKVTLALFFDREFMSEAGSKSVNQKAVDLFEAAENVCSKPICETVFKAGGSLVLNPFPDADERWCKQCAQECFACLVHDLVLMMPLD